MSRHEPENGGDDPNPIPNDLSTSAPIHNDVERAYTPNEMALDEKRLMAGASTSALEGIRHKTGRGLTEGDMGEDLLSQGGRSCDS